MDPLGTPLILLFSTKAIIDDVYARRVSNRLLAAGLAFGIALHFLPQGWAHPPSWGSTVIGLAGGFLALLPFYAAGWMGAGDVKLFSVIGFLVGWKTQLAVWVIASLLSGVHASMMLLWKRLLGLSPIGMQMCLESARSRWMRHRWHDHIEAARKGRKGIPYAAYLGVGLVAVTFTGTGGW